MKIVLVSKCSLDIEQYVEFKISVLISPSKSLISSRWVTYDFNRLWVKGHLGVNDLWFKVLKKGHCIDVFSWDLDTVILGWSHTCDLNRLGVKGHLGVNDLLFKFWYGIKSDITMFAKVCDRESRQDLWFENCLVDVLAYYVVDAQQALFI